MQDLMVAIFTILPQIFLLKIYRHLLEVPKSLYNFWGWLIKNIDETWLSSLNVFFTFYSFHSLFINIYKTVIIIYPPHHDVHIMLQRILWNYFPNEFSSAPFLLIRIEFRFDSIFCTWNRISIRFNTPYAFLLHTPGGQLGGIYSTNS